MSDVIKCSVTTCKMPAAQFVVYPSFHHAWCIDHGHTTDSLSGFGAHEITRDEYLVLAVMEK